jgi:RNA 2',3'-cyclic 3'-phosphodiesterase
MRLFIGLPLPTSLQNSLKESWTGISNKPGHLRPFRPSLWHLTIAFLGEVEPERLDPLKELVAKAAAHPPKGGFSIDRFETFPKKKPNRIVARARPLDVDSWKPFVETVVEMVSIAAPNVDRKPWLPHISITRTLKKTTLDPWHAAIKPPVIWKSNKLAIIHSTPTSHGSIYKNLHVFPLDI